MASRVSDEKSQDWGGEASTRPSGVFGSGSRPAFLRLPSNQIKTHSGTGASHVDQDLGLGGAEHCLRTHQIEYAGPRIPEKIIKAFRVPSGLNWPSQ